MVVVLLYLIPKKRVLQAIPMSPVLLTFENILVGQVERMACASEAELTLSYPNNHSDCQKQNTHSPAPNQWND
jgi:hypothetical protein